jgi:hypothetical protein
MANRPGFPCAGVEDLVVGVGPDQGTALAAFQSQVGLDEGLSYFLDGAQQFLACFSLVLKIRDHAPETVGHVVDGLHEGLTSDTSIDSDRASRFLSLSLDRAGQVMQFMQDIPEREQLPPERG